MKKYIIYITSICITIIYPSHSILSQEDVNVIDLQELREDNKKQSISTEEAFQYEEKPFVTVEKMPQFKGGEKDLFEFINNNLIYPELSKENGVEGRVLLRFIIKKDGKIDDIQIIRKLENLCDEEAVRIVKLMPDWIPGKQNERPVPVYFTLPILFKLEADENPDPIYKKNEVDKEAKFNGNLNAYFKENYTELNLPTEGGRIKVNFIIEKDGTISNVKTVESLTPQYDNAAVKFIKSMPKWIPAKKDGVTVRSIQHINFNITYQSEEKASSK